MDDLTLLGFAGLLAAVTFGAVVPVLPTGPMLSAAAVLAFDEHPPIVLLVVVTGAVAAYTGDAITFVLLRRTQGTLSRRLPWLSVDDPEGTVRGVGERLERDGARALVLARLVPGGRIPVILAAAVGGYPLGRFAVANVAAVTAWATVYALIGLVGGAIFPSSTVALVVAITIAVLVSVVPGVVRRWRTTP